MRGQTLRWQGRWDGLRSLAVRHPLFVGGALTLLTTGLTLLGLGR